MSIASEITRLQNDSGAIAAAIADKGVTVPAGSGYDDYAALIGQISGGSPTDFDEWVKDGDTHIWINIIDPYQLTQTLRIRMIGTIDWGDGSAESNVSVTSYTTLTHTYTSPGRYRIDLKPTEGTFYLGGGSASYNVMGEQSAHWRTGACYQVEIGTKQITSISAYAFYYLYGVRRIYVPQTITSIGSNICNACYSLTEIIFEDSTKITSTSLNSQFSYCYNLQNASFAPPNATSMSNTFRGCISLHEVIIGESVTSIAANTFNSMGGLIKMKCLPATPPTVAAASAFTGLSSTCVIEVPSGKLSAYQAASYWSTYASQMVEATT